MRSRNDSCIAQSKYSSVESFLYKREDYKYGNFTFITCNSYSIQLLHVFPHSACFCIYYVSSETSFASTPPSVSASKFFLLLHLLLRLLCFAFAFQICTRLESCFIKGFACTIALPKKLKFNHPKTKQFTSKLSPNVIIQFPF